MFHSLYLQCSGLQTGCVFQELTASHVFDDLPEDRHYQLAGMVSYSGHHYTAAIRLADQWWTADNTNNQCVGSWSALVKKLKAGQSRPRLLLYEQC